MDEEWQCLVVGGGATGLSAALVLGRARRGTLVIDAGEQSNLSAHGIGGLLGHDGRTPSELYELGRKELQQYPSVEVRKGVVQTAESRRGGFDVRLSDGTQVRARRLLLAMGMEYRPPALPGLDAIWGVRCSTVPSAMGGRSAINRWRCGQTASARCTWHGCCVGGATTWCC